MRATMHQNLYKSKSFFELPILFLQINFLIRFGFVRIEVREIGGRKCIVFSQQEDEDTTVATIIIRASTAHVLNDVEVNISHLFTY
jgi:chaperonin GroEL (HSP60 family)